MAIIAAWLWLYEAIALIIIVWLLSASPITKTLIDVLPHWLSDIGKYLPPPATIGLRFGLTGLGLIFIGLLIYRLKNFKAAHGKALESATELRKYEGEDRDEFISLAKNIEKIRLLLIAVLFFWGEAMALSFAHAHNPHFVERFISSSWLVYL